MTASLGLGPGPRGHGLALPLWEVQMLASRVATVQADAEEDKGPVAGQYPGFQRGTEMASLGSEAVDRTAPVVLGPVNKPDEWGPAASTAAPGWAGPFASRPTVRRKHSRWTEALAALPVAWGFAGAEDAGGRAAVGGSRSLWAPPAGAQPAPGDTKRSPGQAAVTALVQTRTHH